MSGREDGHLVDLPGTEWSVWREALLRSAGFPAAGLDRFSAPACAAVADAFLDGRASQAELDSANAAALEQARQAAAEILADPLFREAIVWQNPALLSHLTHQGDPAATGKKAQKQRGRRKARENTIARYWQRYCGKNDTNGFFGPVAWVTLDPGAPAVEVRCGDALVTDRETYYEFWALEAFAGRLAADPVVRPWLPAGLQPHLTVDGARVLRPGQEPLELSGAEAELLSRCDGRRAALAAAGDMDRTAALTLLEGLAARGVIWWGVDLPQNPGAELTLRSVLAAIPDESARELALSRLQRLDVARAAIAAAAGDPDKLAAAMSGLDAEFTSLTGDAPQRRPGQMYAGRKLCYEDAVRDVEVTFGGPVLTAMAGPFGKVLLPAARWLSVALAEAYSARFRGIYRELLDPAEQGVPLDRFWFAAKELFSVTAPPLGEVAQEFARRWAGMLELDQVAPGTRRVSFTSADLEGRVAEFFPAARAGWAAARIHSPDLAICAPSAAALAQGDFTMVLGELHAAWPTLDVAMFTGRHPDPARLRAAAAADLGPQLLPAYASWCPQFSPRLTSNLREEYLLAFAPEPGADPAMLLPVMEIKVSEHEGKLVATARDGRRWPLIEMFSAVIGWLGSELFRLSSAQPHNPRITIDQVVVSRETWRLTVGRSGMTTKDQLAEYLAARRLRASLDLPEKVFARISTEIKPVYLDLTSPRYVSAFATMLRTAREKEGDEAGVVMTELLPGPDQAWLPDASGQRYFSELRLHMLDPVPVT